MKKKLVTGCIGLASGDRRGGEFAAVSRISRAPRVRREGSAHVTFRSDVVLIRPAHSSSNVIRPISRGLHCCTAGWESPGRGTVSGQDGLTGEDSLWRQSDDECLDWPGTANSSTPENVDKLDRSGSSKNYIKSIITLSKYCRLFSTCKKTYFTVFYLYWSRIDQRRRYILYLILLGSKFCIPIIHFISLSLLRFTDFGIKNVKVKV